MKIKLFTAVWFLLVVAMFAQETPQTFLSLKQTGVQEFLNQHPEYDGRGTIVFIFDTGVDFGIDGLTTTSTGEVKMIDVQDFTGQGDLNFYEADTDEDDGVNYFVNEDHEYKVAGADKLPLKADDEYYIGVFPEKLLMNSGSGAADLNENGSEEDNYYFVVFNTTEAGETFPVMFFDTDCDGDLSDEKPIRTYKQKLDGFAVETGNDLPLLTMGANIFMDEGYVSFHFDDGAHGTHCAGISTGNSIGGNNFNGVAPGAYLISCKLGNNNYSGGATVTESMKKCFLYADKVSKEREEPCIINMSFGIASEIEGHADMELFLEELVKDNPYLYICTSNGNEGPGISTAGLPAASSYIFSSGAILTKEVGGELYGANIPQDIILYFSSRGAETNKPDVVSPGACTSTVPNWEGGDRYWGTSMASPYSAGVMSLLLSAAKVDFPDVKVPSRLLYNAVKAGATHMDEYTYLDQGAGYINVVKAYDVLKKYIKDGEIDKFETYTVSAPSPNMPNGKAENLYFRNGSFLKDTDAFAVKIKRDGFYKSDKFYRVFNVKSSADWLKPTQKKTYIRNDQSATITLQFDTEKMQEPGLYSARVYGNRADKSAFPEFEFNVTVVIPHEFTAENNYTMEDENTVAPGMQNRYYVNVPLGASSMKVQLAAEDNHYASLRYRLHDPDGRQFYSSRPFVNADVELSKGKYFYDVEPGVYELIVNGFFQAKDTSDYDLKVKFFGLAYDGNNEISKEHNYMWVTNTFSTIKNYYLGATVEGYCKQESVEIDSSAYMEIPFVLKENEASKTFDISVSKEDFNKFTDFAVMINDEEGKSLRVGALSYKSSTISIRNTFSEDKNLKLVLVPGFANAGSELTANIVEKTELKDKIKGKATIGGSPRVSLYPSIKSKIEFKFSDPDFEIPEGQKLYGVLKFTNTSNNEKELELPLHFNF